MKKEISNVFKYTQFGVNKLYKGDCLGVMPLIIDNKSIHLILADIPFGTTKSTWDTPINLDKLWEQYKRIIKPNGAILLFAQTPYDA